MRHLLFGLLSLLVLIPTIQGQTGESSDFTLLFNGQDFSNWKVPQGDNGHWRVMDGVIDYDGESEAKEKHLWSEQSFKNFELMVDWRIKETPYINPRVPIILPSGLHKLDKDGNVIRTSVPDSDSGILIRGQMKSQVNIWCWPIGSGEVYGYRNDESLPANVRAGVVPTINADHHIGEWNTYKIRVVGEHLTVVLNDQTVIKDAWLPNLPSSGPVGLQHHGNKKNGKWSSPPALVQFKNIAIQELPDVFAEVMDHPDSKDWPLLFGDDLSLGIDLHHSWRLEGDVMVADKDESIWSDRTYEDFILDLAFKNAPGTNSGIILHCRDRQEWVPNSIEVQIADDYAEKWAKSPKNWQCGAIFGRVEPSERTVKVAGEWNRCTVISQDRMIKVMVNGKWVSEMNMDEHTKVAINPDGTSIPEWLKHPPATLAAHGQIGLQGKHGDAPIYFRDVRIKDLD
ncbi:MAG: DUF1080 domain-containing protein [Saprospiraceae bacterium]|nr:DUF1080 domain-containing protein [Saprospiraceae bacterium]